MRIVRCVNPDCGNCGYDIEVYDDGSNVVCGGVALGTQTCGALLA